MAIDYDARVIQLFAEKLYKKARWIVINYMIMCALPGLFILIGGPLANSYKYSTGLIIAIGIIVVGVGLAIGYQLGREKSFILRLQAQTALCQVRIEANTRHA